MVEARELRFDGDGSVVASVDRDVADVGERVDLEPQRFGRAAGSAVLGAEPGGSPDAHMRCLGVLAIAGSFVYSSGSSGRRNPIK